MRAIALHAPADGSECQLESPLAFEYLEKKRYDESWEVVRKARGEGRWIQPELLDRPKKESRQDR